MKPTMIVPIIKIWLKALAPFRVGNADREKRERCSDINAVGGFGGDEAPDDEEADKASDEGSFFVHIDFL
jgi:hypothetical protein